jgi:hypothetical protein
MHVCFVHSLRELARYLRSRPQYDSVSIIRANVVFGAREESAQVVRLMGRYGFEPVKETAPVTARKCARRLGENILISLMVLAHNGAALRRSTLRRDRVQMLLSRRMLERRYGPGASQTDSDCGAHPWP